MNAISATEVSEIGKRSGTGDGFGDGKRTRLSDLDASHEQQGKLERTSPAHQDTLEDIAGHIYPGIVEFFPKFFSNRPWTADAEHFVQAPDSQYGPIHDQKKFESLESLTSWFRLVELHLAQHAENKYMKRSWRAKDTGSVDNPNWAVVLTESQNTNKIQWGDVEVVGKIQQNHSYQEGFLQLCEYARSTFAAQSARVFLHGFYVSENHVEFCLFDRSGVYLSPQLNMGQDISPFLLAVLGYMMMEEDERGVSQIVKRDTFGRQFIEVARSDGTGSDKFQRGDNIYRQADENLVGDGISVYRAKLSTREHGEYAVKLKWFQAVDDEEFRVLKLIKERDVWGVCWLEHHLVDSSDTDTLHQGLKLGRPRKLQLKEPGPPTGCRISASCMVETDSKEPDCARALHCSIVTPLGRTLHHYGTVLEVLQALAHAVRAHKSLYLVGKILHKDISPSNIIIPNEPGGRFAGINGVLIDLDLAEETSAPYIPFQASGTGIFKSIGVLQAYLPDNPHTYRHDLESFFYVFLFLAICPRPIPPGANRLVVPESSVLREWDTGRPFDRANRKIDLMDPDKFHQVVAEFTPEFMTLSGLAEKLRVILFPIRDDKLWTGTDMTLEGTLALYEGIIRAFEDAASDHAEL